MTRDVEELLEERRHRSHRRGEALSLAVAVAIHAAAVIVALVLPALGHEPPEPPEIARVQIVPLQALGRRDVPPEPEPEPPAAEPPRETAPPEPEPEPEPPPPEPEPTPEPRTPPPDPTPPRPEPRETPREPTPSREPPPPATSEPGRRGSPEGSPLGTSAIGVEAGVDNPDFRYDYYLERMLALIETQWRRPSTEERLETTIHFRIAADGRVTDLAVARESGHRAFDLAALRAVQRASPLPPLPRSYRKDSLGVNLIFR